MKRFIICCAILLVSHLALAGQGGPSSAVKLSDPAADVQVSVGGKP